MNLLITGICGFVGSTLARALCESSEKLRICGVDNLSRPGSEMNRAALGKLGVKFIHADIRSQTDLAGMPSAEWVIDAAANPSVLAGIEGAASSRKVVEHNLLGTVNLLEYCKLRRAGFILLSTSRVYSIAQLAALPLEVHRQAYRLAPHAQLPPGLTANGVIESFSTAPPVSLYGSTKLASETLALEYGETFGFPVWINRCGVLAGAGQFGKADQGIFSFWLHSHCQRRPLKFIGFSGSGHQVRDCLHPRDLVPLLARQMNEAGQGRRRIQNLGGGLANSMSLAQLHEWCDARFGRHPAQAEPQARRFDIPWLVMDSALAASQWDWRPATGLESILEEIAVHAQQNPNWLELTAV